MDIDALREKVSAATEKVEKCKSTVVRHRTQLDKRLIKARDLGCPIPTDDAEYLKNYWSYYDRSGFSNEQVWAIIDINTKLDDIKGAMRKLSDAEQTLRGWESKLANAIELERTIEENCPPVIKAFLEQWKTNCTEYYRKKYEKWPEFTESLKDAVRNARIECLRGVAEVGAAQFVADNHLEDKIWQRTSLLKPAVDADTKAAKLEAWSEAYAKDWCNYCENNNEFFLNNVFPRTLMDAYLKSRELDWQCINTRRREYGGDLLLKMVEQGGEADAFAYLEKALEAEKKAKIIDLVNRIEKVVGRIVDGDDLHIGPKGDLEGIIIGETGKAKINTIGAGGYNIQCFHFRTLIHEIKDKDLQSILADAKDRSENYNREMDSCRSDKEMEI